MKQLLKTFVKNCDHCGNHTFTQLRREGSAAVYRRNKVADGRFEGIEVFLLRTIKEGSPLPGGGQVAETYEQYPGAAAFGRRAWSFTGIEAAATRAAMARFECLLKGTAPIVETEPEDEEMETVPVLRVSRSLTPRRQLNLPDKPFSQKELAAFNGIENYKEVYTDLQRMLGNGTLVLGDKREKKDGARGKCAQLFKTPAMKSLPVVEIEA
jgi:hypothetical protein